MSWVERLNALDIDLIVTHHLYVCTKLAEVLVKVVGKRVVVIDDQQHKRSVAPIRFGNAYVVNRHVRDNQGRYFAIPSKKGKFLLNKKASIGWPLVFTAI